MKDLQVINSPDSFISQAIQSNAPIETLERLMALKERHDAGQARRDFIDAMQRFQAIKPDLKKSSNVSFNTGKGTTEYSFCSLADMEKALREPLEKCGLSYRYENIAGVGTFGVRCIVTHVSGHSESTEMSAPLDSSGNKNSIQGIGSTSTYLMRYTLIAAFALTTADTDDDGASNSELPLLKLINQSKTLQDLPTLQAVVMVKESIAAADYRTAAEILHHMGSDKLGTLWVAPTKGGIFTTAEIAAIKSNEFSALRSQIAIEETKTKG